MSETSRRRQNMKVGIVGSGLMGSGIAEACARAGLDVVISEVSDELITKGRARIERSLDRAVERGKLEAADRDTALARIRFTTDLTDMHDRQIVIEAATEHEATKLGIFSSLDEIVEATDAILASNTSSIPIARLGRATRRPESVIGIHFFNPVPVMQLVEVTPSILTSKETIAGADAFAGDVLGKKVIHAKDQAGFIVNALLIPMLLNAIRMVESGLATAEEIDTGVVEGLRHPMGPLTLTDFVGLDTTKYVADVLYEEFKNPSFAAPPLLVRMVEAGLLGKKSGKGFYDYS
ncbi:MAG TPA: 3-hydroxybutyryl-CoA dehydrogenase [Actinobacteria bacterium]|nr:3-hydroxybutyryl-CoA dehydrogenase [Actinomycetota bacterium]HDL49098.1 3-hydroxybutyryl-CoA dehydrogenase [Actinomycetota bacterium]